MKAIRIFIALLLMLSFVISISYAQENKLNFYVDTATFAVSRGSSQVEIYYQIPYPELTFREVNEKDDPALQEVFKYIASFDVEMAIIDMDGNKLAADTTLALAGAQTIEDTEKFTQSMRKVRTLVVTPGEFKLTIKITGSESGKSELKLIDIVTPEYLNTENITISDIQISSLIRQAEIQNQFYKNGVEIIPNPKNEFGDVYPNLYFYYEVYNLEKTTPNTIKKTYKILNEAGETVKEVAGGLTEKAEIMSGEVGRIGIADLPEGDYQLNVIVEDLGRNQVANSVHDFGIKYHFQSAIAQDFVSDKAIKRASGEELEDYFRGIKYIASKDELKALDKLKTEEEKRQFLINFWNARGLQAKANHYQLVEFANKNYMVFNKEGWQTERGRVLVKYGKPDDIERHPIKMGTPEYHVWRYYGIQGYFIFADTNIKGDWMLVDSNVKGEIYDPEWKNYGDGLIKGQKSLEVDESTGFGDEDSNN